MRKSPEQTRYLSIIEMCEYLEAVLDKMLPFIDDPGDLDSVFAEELDRALRHGTIAPDVHQELCSEFGIEA